MSAVGMHTQTRFSHSLKSHSKWDMTTFIQEEAVIKTVRERKFQLEVRNPHLFYSVITSGPY